MLTESLDPARFIRSSQWRQEGLEIVLRSLDNNNLRTVSEYEVNRCFVMHFSYLGVDELFTRL